MRSAERCRNINLVVIFIFTGLLFTIHYNNSSVESELTNYIKGYIELERIQLPSGNIVIAKQDQKWRIKGIATLNMNDASRPYTSDICL